jgi:hypothetical protein
MEKLMAGMLAVLVMACATPYKTEPQILPTVQAEKQVEVENEPDAYLVRINFVMFEPEIAQSPKTAKAFDDALTEWARNLPIECAVFIDKAGSFPFLPFGPQSITDQRGVVRVHIADIQVAPYNMPKDLLGFWDWDGNTLVLDKDVLEMDPDKAYVVALHELGHIFGLPHFLNVGAAVAATGCYVVPEKFDARKLVMYPISSDLNKCSKLTKLEISLAWKNLPVLQQVGRNECFQLTSH